MRLVVVVGVVGVIVMLAVGWLLRRRRFEGETPVTERWRAQHDYGKHGDDR